MERENGRIGDGIEPDGSGGTAHRLEAVIVCPACHSRTRQQMPVDACIWFWECPACHVLARPLPGDCCVFCSYADVACPPRQAGERCCGPRGAG